MSDPNIIKPLVLTNRGHFKQLMVITLVLVAIVAALYRLLIPRPVLFYYSLFGSIFAFLLSCLLYLFAPSNNIPIFRIRRVFPLFS